jgi:hypothetical protein
MKCIYDVADSLFIQDSECARQEQERAEFALSENPLRAVTPFTTDGAGAFLHMRPLHVSLHDLRCALESAYGPDGFTLTHHTTKTQWWKDTNLNHKYIVCGEMNTSSVLPEGKVDWEEFESMPATWEHVIAVSGGRFYCKNIKRWIPTKYLWLAKIGQPKKTKRGGRVTCKGLLKTIQCVYKVER